MFLMKMLAGLGLALSLLPSNAFGEVAAAPAAAVAQAIAAPVAAVAPGVAPTAAPAVPMPVIPPYRTWITIEAFEMVNNGEPSNPISNVKVQVHFPGDKRFELPESGQYWTIGNGQKQEIKRTYELPWNAINNDGLEFTVQMVRQGSKMLPCNFKVNQLSQYNRSYFCHTDLQWQMDQKITEERLDKEGIQIRVWTDRNTPVKEQPKDALALK